MDPTTDPQNQTTKKEKYCPFPTEPKDWLIKLFAVLTYSVAYGGCIFGSRVLTKTTSQ